MRATASCIAWRSSGGTAASAVTNSASLTAKLSSDTPSKRAVISRNAEVKHQTLLTTGLTAFQALLTFLLAFAMARQFLQREKATAQAMAAQTELVEALKRNEEVLEARFIAPQQALVEAQAKPYCPDSLQALRLYLAS